MKRHSLLLLFALLIFALSTACDDDDGGDNNTNGPTDETDPIIAEMTINGAGFDNERIELSKVEARIIPEGANIRTLLRLKAVFGDNTFEVEITSSRESTAPAVGNFPISTLPNCTGSTYVKLTISDNQGGLAVYCPNGLGAVNVTEETDVKIVGTFNSVNIAPDGTQISIFTGLYDVELDS